MSFCFVLFELVLFKPEDAVEENDPDEVENPTDCTSRDYPDDTKNHVEPVLFAGSSTDTIDSPSNI